MVLSALPVLLATPLPEFTSLEGYALYLGELVGYLGLTMLLWQYVMGVRSLSGLVFRDLAPVLRIHKALGKYGSLFIFAHPLLMALNYMQLSVLIPTELPDFSDPFQVGLSLGRVAMGLLVTVWLTSAFFRTRLSYRSWKYIHFLAYFVLPFALVHVPLVGTRFIDNDVLRTYYFVIVLTLLIATVLRLRGWLNTNRTTYRVTGHQQVADGTYQLDVAADDSNRRALPGRAGQYVYVKHGIVSEDHPFSIMSINDDNITLGYRTEGRFTQYLATLNVGDTISLNGPYGTFLGDVDPERAVFVAGGIGITPFYDYVLTAKTKPWLFYANRSHSSAPFLTQLKVQLGNRFVAVFSQDEPRKNEMKGYVDLPLLTARLGNDLHKYDFYICGPPVMNESLTKALREAGVADMSIRVEPFDFR